MPTGPSYRGRFAPSPTGPLHLGSLATALGSWLLARHAGGQWWLRVEDLDPPREIPGAAIRQLSTLAAFGLRSDAPVEWQSRRGPHYQAAVERLLAEGKAFWCPCTRSELAARNGIHHHCPGKGRGHGKAIRLRVPEGTQLAFDDGLQGHFSQDVWREVGDFVLKRADGLWAYQLATVVDDAAQGMTDIVRGADLLDSTPRQILLQQALQLPSPRYLHLPVITDTVGRKLSKSCAALPIDEAEPMPALRVAWRALGQLAIPDGTTRDAASFLGAAESCFDPGRLPRTRAIPLAALHNEADTKAD